jgi:hypothetical protein
MIQQPYLPWAWRCKWWCACCGCFHTRSSQTLSEYGCQETRTTALCAAVAKLYENHLQNHLQRQQYYHCQFGPQENHYLESSQFGLMSTATEAIN